MTPQRRCRDAACIGHNMNPFSTHPQDIVISSLRCVCTCSACPEQYDVFDDKTGRQVGYLRLRHGVFRAEAPGCGGAVVYCAHTEGDGCFDDDERLQQMSAAVAAIKSYVA